jgi:hypothetical protein
LTCCRERREPVISGQRIIGQNQRGLQPEFPEELLFFFNTLCRKHEPLPAQFSPDELGVGLHVFEHQYAEFPVYGNLRGVLDYIMAIKGCKCAHLYARPLLINAAFLTNLCL